MWMLARCHVSARALLLFILLFIFYYYYSLLLYWTVAWLQWQAVWFVGMSAGLHKNDQTNFHQIRIEDESQLRTDPVNFWCWSRQRDASRNCFALLSTLWTCWLMSRGSGWYLWVSTEGGCWSSVEVCTLLNTVQFLNVVLLKQRRSFSVKCLQDDDSSRLSVGAQCEASHHLKNNNLFPSKLQYWRQTCWSQNKKCLTSSKVWIFAGFVFLKTEYYFLFLTKLRINNESTDGENIHQD